MSAEKCDSCCSCSDRVQQCRAQLVQNIGRLLRSCAQGDDWAWVVTGILQRLLVAGPRIFRPILLCRKWVGSFQQAQWSGRFLEALVQLMIGSCARTELLQQQGRAAVAGTVRGPPAGAATRWSTTR